MEIGYTMTGEQSGPKAMVRDLQLAEAAGFDSSVISDHYSPWLDATTRNNGRPSNRQRRVARHETADGG